MLAIEWESRGGMGLVQVIFPPAMALFAVDSALQAVASETRQPRFPHVASSLRSRGVNSAP